MAVLALTLGFTFNHPIGTLGVLMIASATFAAIILALNVWLGSVGQFMGLLLMMLQLVTAGGTFPWQTLPAPLAALHHVLTLGHVVDAMRQLMYGGNMARAVWGLAVLGLWLDRALVLAMIGIKRMHTSPHPVRPAAQPHRLSRGSKPASGEPSEPASPL